MKAKKIVYRSEENFLSTPRVILAKILSEDEFFVCALTGRGKTYRIAKSVIISIEDSDKEFELEGAN